MEVLIIDSRAPCCYLGVRTLPRVDGYFFREKKELRTNVLNYFDEALCSTLRRYRESVEGGCIDTNVDKFIEEVRREEKEERNENKYIITICATKLYQVRTYRVLFFLNCDNVNYSFF